MLLITGSINVFSQISEDKKKQIQSQYDNVDWSTLKNDGYIEIEKNNFRGALDKNGNTLFPCQYSKIIHHNNDKYFEVTSKGKVGILDEKGKLIFPCIYDEIIKQEDQDYYELTYNGKVGIFDLKGKELIPCIYDEVYYYPTFEEDIYAKVTRNGKLGIFDVSKGKEIVSCSYTFIRINEEKAIALVCAGGKYIPNTFKNRILDVGEHFEENGKWGYFDLANARSLIPCEYDYVKTAGENLFLYNIGGKVSDPYKMPKGGLWGIIDSNGKKLFNAEYTEISNFKDGVAKAVKNGVASILVNPNTGTKLLLANGISACAIDNNIPKVNQQNEETFAFIFANENYKNCPGADFSINDGKIFEKYCNQTLGIPETNIKYYEDATFGNIQSAMKKIQDIADVYDGDAKIIFYYSGLGNTVEGERYILPSDASLASVKTTGISVNNVLQILNSLNTKYTLALFDAPFNGTDKSGKLLESARGVRVKSKAPYLSGKTIAVFGSSEDKNNYCYKDYGHGLLTYSFLEQIQKTKGEISIKTMLDNAISNVGKQSLKEFNDIQKPQLIISETMGNNWQSLKF